MVDRNDLPEDSYVLDEECYDAAIVGVTHDDRVVYSYDLLAEVILDNSSDDMTIEDAYEYIDVNITKAISYYGEHAPVIMYSLIDYE